MTEAEVKGVRSGTDLDYGPGAERKKFFFEKGRTSGIKDISKYPKSPHRFFFLGGGGVT